MRFLVTAGNTRELIDRVRDWGNIFTGTTGYNIARALASIGEVDLLTSNESHIKAKNPGVHGSHFRSHADLRALLAERMRTQQYDAVFMTAAVADYKPAGAFEILGRNVNADGTESWTVRNIDRGKIKSSHAHVAFTGEPTEKLIDLFRTEWKYAGLLVKFKLEVGLNESDLIRVGQQSRAASGADYLVANTLEMVPTGAILLGDQLVEPVARDRLAARLVRLVQEKNSATKVTK
jgi:phosphopantothenate---cysteine ligase (CTP)